MGLGTDLRYARLEGVVQCPGFNMLWDQFAFSEDMKSKPLVIGTQVGMNPALLPFLCGAISVQMRCPL